MPQHRGPAGSNGDDRGQSKSDGRRFRSDSEGANDVGHHRLVGVVDDAVPEARVAARQPGPEFVRRRGDYGRAASVTTAPVITATQKARNFRARSR